MIKLGSGFKFPKHIDLSVLDTIPVYVHKYGNEQPDKNQFFWMMYKDEGVHKGTIGFARNVSTFMPEASAYVIEYLESILTIKLDPSRVNFMKTDGDITPHRDEGGRLCCINIGVHGGPNAITRVGVNNELTSFYDAHIDYVVEDGCAYLLDVSRIHAVKTVRPEPRLLVTYGFGVTADKIFNVSKVSLLHVKKSPL